ncbi:hypothetical protein ANANG_G00299790 [Anguilla anguilla]|uniref:GDNF/GAS1 domain-containing protein n=1 Tax=Anguilla anguilla TaxID=7936 RepID=A0A9D3LJC1_ANGAN|nr:hypothetical protein ANANG_G00299790 [Anguilla anguilla]
MGLYRAPVCSTVTMKIALVTGFLACQVICSFSSRSRDCVSVKEACVSESRACRSGWDLLKNVCHISDGSCQVVDSEECNMTIAYLLGQFPQWKGCLCTEEDYCRTPQLLAPNCHAQPGAEASKQPPSWFEPDVSPASVSPEGQGCVSVLLGCQESPTAELESSAQPLPKAMQQNMGKVKAKKDSKPDWQRSGLLKEARDAARSCLRAMTACVYDEVCNGQLAPLVRACSGSPCQDAACGRATGRFYRRCPPPRPTCWRSAGATRPTPTACA